ncbi:hypothetical protein OC845_006405 [Tilletia horrida]|nr:hypothetical protein OC845_006405 [Tilletia horrida]
MTPFVQQLGSDPSTSHHQDPALNPGQQQHQQNFAGFLAQSAQTQIGPFGSASNFGLITPVSSGNFTAHPAAHVSPFKMPDVYPAPPQLQLSHQHPQTLPPQIPPQNSAPTSMPHHHGAPLQQQQQQQQHSIPGTPLQPGHLVINTTSAQSHNMVSAFTPMQSPAITPASVFSQMSIASMGSTNDFFTPLTSPALGPDPLGSHSHNHHLPPHHINQQHQALPHHPHHPHHHHQHSNSHSSSAMASPLFMAHSHPGQQASHPGAQHGQHTLQNPQAHPHTQHTQHTQHPSQQQQQQQQPMSSTPTASPLALIGKPSPATGTGSGRSARSARSEAKASKVRPSPIIKPTEPRSNSRHRGANNASSSNHNSVNGNSSLAAAIASSAAAASHSLVGPSPTASPHILPSAASTSNSVSFPSIFAQSHGGNARKTTMDASPSEAASTPSPIDLSATSMLPPASIGPSKPLTPSTVMGIRSSSSTGTAGFQKHSPSQPSNLSESHYAAGGGGSQQGHGTRGGNSSTGVQNTPANGSPESSSGSSAAKGKGKTDQSVRFAEGTLQRSGSQSKANNKAASSNGAANTSGDGDLDMDDEGRASTTPTRASGESRRTSHKAAEQKRRDSLKFCFDELRGYLPNITLDEDAPGGSTLCSDGFAQDAGEEGFDWDEVRRVKLQQEMGILPIMPSRPGVPPPPPPEYTTAPRGSIERHHRQEREMAARRMANKGISKVALLRHSNEYLVRLKKRLERREERIEVLEMERNHWRDRFLSLEGQLRGLGAAAVAAAAAANAAPGPGPAQQQQQQHPSGSLQARATASGLDDSTASLQSLGAAGPGGPNGIAGIGMSGHVGAMDMSGSMPNAQQQPQSQHPSPHPPRQQHHQLQHQQHMQGSSLPTGLEGMGMLDVSSNDGMSAAATAAALQEFIEGLTNIGLATNPSGVGGAGQSGGVQGPPGQESLNGSMGGTPGSGGGGLGVGVIEMETGGGH